MSRSAEAIRDGSVEDGETDFFDNVQRVHITLRGENLDAMDPSLMGGKSDPYVIVKVPRSTDKPLPNRLLGALISRSTPEETDLLGNHTLHKTEVVYNSLDPVWNPMMLYLDKRKDMANDAKIILEVWDKDRGSADDLIGIAEVKVSDLLKKGSRIVINRGRGSLAGSKTLANAAARAAKLAGMDISEETKQSGTLIVEHAEFDMTDTYHIGFPERLVDRSSSSVKYGDDIPKASLEWKGDAVVMTMTNDTGRMYEGTLTLSGGLRYFDKPCGKGKTLTWRLSPDKNNRVEKKVLIKKPNADEHMLEWNISFRVTYKLCPVSVNDATWPVAWRNSDSKEMWDFEKPEDKQTCKAWAPARLLGRDASAVIFDGIDANDISQGEIGDCWVLAAISCVADQDDGKRIKKLFKTQEVNPDGLYTIQLFDVISETWISHTIDEMIPCKKLSDGSYKSVVVDPNGEEIWVPLLEKAMAKHFGGYSGIGEGGFEWIALQCLTGTVQCIWYAKDDDYSNTWTNSVIKHSEQKKEGKLSSGGPWFCYPREDKVESYETAEELYGLICRLLEDKHLLCCSINKDEDDDTEGEGTADLGLVTGHAYSILRVEYLEISDDGETERFIKLRNPWGSHEWTGKWSDGDLRWKKYPNVAYHLGYTNEDDGSFWMPFDYFFLNFSRFVGCLCGNKSRGITRSDDDGGEPIKDWQKFIVDYNGSHPDSCKTLSSKDRLQSQNKVSDPIVKGICPKCGQNVMSTDERTKDATGQYCHQQCPVAAARAIESPAVPAIVKGLCPKCGQNVMSTDERTKDATGQYCHQQCPVAANIESPAGPAIVKGLCSKCGKNVLATDERTKDSTGQYCHQQCP